MGSVQKRTLGKDELVFSDERQLQQARGKHAKIQVTGVGGGTNNPDLNVKSFELFYLSIETL